MPNPGKSPNKSLTPKEKIFANAFLKTFNLTQSARIAYKDNHNADTVGSITFSRPHVQRYVQARLAKLGLSDDEPLKHIKKIMRESTSAKALRQVKPSDGLKAIELLWRKQDKFPSQKREVISKTVNLNLNAQTDNELIKLLKNQEKDIKKYRLLLGRVKGKSIRGKIVNP